MPIAKERRWSHFSLQNHPKHPEPISLGTHTLNAFLLSIPPLSLLPLRFSPLPYLILLPTYLVFSCSLICKMAHPEEAWGVALPFRCFHATWVIPKPGQGERTLSSTWFQKPLFWRKKNAQLFLRLTFIVDLTTNVYFGPPNNKASGNLFISTTFLHYHHISALLQHLTQPRHFLIW